MTVNELVWELRKLQNDGHGETHVFAQGDYSGAWVHLTEPSIVRVGHDGYSYPCTRPLSPKGEKRYTNVREIVAL